MLHYTVRNWIIAILRWVWTTNWVKPSALNSALPQSQTCFFEWASFKLFILMLLKKQINKNGIIFLHQDTTVWLGRLMALWEKTFLSLKTWAKLNKI